jgi:hypothetical protein
MVYWTFWLCVLDIKRFREGRHILQGRTLEIDVPPAKGPDGRDIGNAKWVINGTIRWTATASKKE